MTADKNKRKKSLFIAFCVACVDNFGFSLVFILFAPLILDNQYGMINPDTPIGVRNLYLGILFATFPLMQFFGAPIFGDIADHLGRKKALYFTILGTIAGFLLSGISIALKSYSLLLISRLITGFFSGNLSIALAILSDLNPQEKNRAKNFGYFTVILGVSWPLSMLVGGYLSDPSVFYLFSPELPFWIAAVLSLVLVYLVKAIYPDEKKYNKNVRFKLARGLHDIIASLKIRQMRSSFFVILFWGLGWILSIQWFASYSLQRFSVSQQLITWALIIQGLFWSLGGAFLKPYLLKFMNTSKIALYTFLCITILFALCSFYTKFWSFTFLYAISSIAGSMALSSSLNLVSISAPKEVQGRALGMGQSMLALASILVPLIGGAIGRIDIRLLYPTCAFFICSGVIILLKINLKKKKAN